MCEVVGKLKREESMVSSGGGGTNVAVGLRRLGMAVKMVSRIGGDDLGEVMKAFGKRGFRSVDVTKRHGKNGFVGGAGGTKRG